MLNYTFIDNDRALYEVAQVFNNSDKIAVDLEADSMFHFREKVCLIQMASESLTVVIDPLMVKDMSPLKPLFADPAIRKIFHGSDYDIRSLHRDFEIEINNLFDTELASRFLGIGETGLSSVLGQRFNICLDKSFQKKDWSKRPLAKDMIEYGARDVIHLLALADILDSELKRKNRGAWVKEECELLSRVRYPNQNGEPLFLRVKGAGRLDRRSLEILENLLRLRSKIAEKKDKPLFKIFSNTSLFELARLRPETMDSLKQSQALSEKQTSTFGEEIISAIQKGCDTPENNLPQYPRRKKPATKPEVPKRFDRLKIWRDNLAEELEIDPPILFNKSLLTEIATVNPKSMEELDGIQGVKNWQKREFGAQLLDILKSKKR